MADRGAAQAPLAVDGDGHVREDIAQLAQFASAPYRVAVSEYRNKVRFPPLDHFHGGPVSVRSGNRGTVGPPEWVQFLEDAGIERTVLYPTEGLAIGKVRDVTWAIMLARAYNDWIKATYLDYDPRFSAMALLPLQDPAAGAKELERAVVELSMPGAMLPSNGLPQHLGSRTYFPVYAMADQLGCCLAVHGGCHDGFGFDDMNVYAPVHALGHPAGLLVSLAGMVFNGIFDQFPRLRVAFLEGGVAWILMALERFEESYEAHVPYDLENGPRLAGRDIARYVKDLMADGRLYFGCEGGEPALNYAVQVLGASPFFYSSDFPHEVTLESCREQMAILGGPEFSPADRQAILRDNALRFYAFG